MAFDFLNKKKEEEGGDNTPPSSNAEPEAKVEDKVEPETEPEPELTLEQQAAKELTDCLAGKLFSEIGLDHPYWKLRDELHMKLHKAKENK